MMAQGNIGIGKIAHRQVVLSNIVELHAYLGDQDIQDNTVINLIKRYVPFVRASKDGSTDGCDIHYQNTLPITSVSSDTCFPAASCSNCKSSVAHGLSLWDYDFLGNQKNGKSLLEVVTGWPDVVSTLRKSYQTAASRGIENSRRDFSADLQPVVGEKPKTYARVLCLSLPANQMVHTPYETDNWTPINQHEHLTIHSTQALQLEVLERSGNRLNCLLKPNIGTDAQYAWTPCCFVLRAGADTVWRDYPDDYDKVIAATLELLYRHSCKQCTIDEMDSVDMTLHAVLERCRSKYDLIELSDTDQRHLQDAISASDDEELEPELADSIYMLKMWHIVTLHTESKTVLSCARESLTAALNRCGIVGQVRRVVEVQSAVIELVSPTPLNRKVTPNNPLLVSLGGETIVFDRATDDYTIVEDESCLPSGDLQCGGDVVIKSELAEEPIKLTLNPYLQHAVTFGMYQCAGQTVANRRCRNRRHSHGHPTFCHWHDNAEQKEALKTYKWLAEVNERGYESMSIEIARGVSSLNLDNSV